jgi:hypothetical protein
MDAPLAQLAEQLTLNQEVPGSIPGRRTNPSTSGRMIMKRPFLVALAVAALVSLAVGLLRGHGKGSGAKPQGVLGRSFVSDSLGVSLRLPESPGWTLRRDHSDSSGAVVTAKHDGGRATVRLLLTPSEGQDLQAVFRQRQAQVAAVFGVQDLNSIVTQVIKDEHKVVDGYPTLQWQAITDVGQVAGEKPSTFMFMWEIFLLKSHAVECLGIVRFDAQPKPEDRAELEGLLQDVAFILQSVQFR